MPNPNEKILKEINDLFYNFIWEGTSRIKRTVLCKEYCDGGLKMTDINAFIAALKSTWLRKLVVEKHSQWSALLQATVSIENMLILGTSYITEKILPRIKNKFWIDVFLAHIQISRKVIPTEVEQFLACPMFYNENIKIGNKPIYNKSCIENGIKFINDITKKKW